MFNIFDDDIFSFDNLYRAYLDCRRNKRSTANAIKFEWNWEENLIELQQELRSKTYTPGRSICFAVDKPALREIFAADFRDRVVHHLLVRQIEFYGERTFIYDSFSCRVGKGAHLAIERLKKFYAKASANYSSPVFYAQMDISGFFMNIDHYILFSIFKKFINKQKRSDKWKEDLLWLGRVIIFHKPTENYIIKGDRKILEKIPPRKSLFNGCPNKGLPIGNYSSQFFSNLFLNELDQFAKRELACRYYLRYVDDFIVLDQDELRLKKISKKINIFLRNHLNMNLNPTKTKIRPMSQGVNFLGYVVKEKYVLARKKVVLNFKNKLEVIRNNNLDIKQDPLQAINSESSVLNSYLGHMRKANSFGLRRDFWEKYLVSNRKEFRIIGGYIVIQVKKDYLNLYARKTLSNVFLDFVLAPD